MTDAEITAAANALIEQEGYNPNGCKPPYQGIDFAGAVRAVVNGNRNLETKRTLAYFDQGEADTKAPDLVAAPTMGQLKLSAA